MVATHNQKKWQTAEGFSFIELVVVILILGILAATVGPATFRWLTTGRENTAKTSVRALAQAIDLYHSELGSYPKELEDLVRKPESGPASKKWTASYLKGSNVPEDPWGNSFQYKVTPGAEHPYELYSYGEAGEGAPEEGRIDAWKL